MAQKKSKERPEEPLGTVSYQTSSKRSPPFWLLIGARKPVVLLVFMNSRKFFILLMEIQNFVRHIFNTNNVFFFLLKGQLRQCGAQRGHSQPVGAGGRQNTRP